MSPCSTASPAPARPRSTFEAIAETIRRGKQTLILMPEIALTGQFLDRFSQRFGVRPIEWHSELTPRTRARNWAAISEGKAPVVVGARSALFMPYADLGLIVVDEEHDQAYKQDDGAHYHARDMAVVRAHIAKIPIVLASATPSIESEVNARKGRYQRVALPSRFGGQHMPHIEAIDLRRAPPPRGRFISPPLAEQIQFAIEKREQALLFLNRRGYAPLTLCRACGHRFACTICDAWLVDHRFRQRLVCHHCGFSMPRPHACPNCAAEESLVAVGPGVERLQEEAAALFPDARTMVLSSDLITSIETMRSELNEIAEGRVDIIIGTQLVAKGHNFPRLNLVGVVDADLGLGNGDPRAAERTFQLLNQVIGRAGRDQGRGVGYLQTHQPEHPVMKALVANDREAFYASEIEARERAGYPPFGRLASLIISAGDRPTAESFARRLVAVAPLDERIQVLGPAEAPLAVIKGRYRFRLLVKSLRSVDLSEYLREWLARRPEDQGQSQARGRCRSAEFFVSSRRHSGTRSWRGPGIILPIVRYGLSRAQLRPIARRFAPRRNDETSPIRPQIGRVSLLDKGVDFRDLLLIAAGAGRENLSERDALGFRPVLGLPEPGPQHRACAVEVAAFDVDPDRQQRRAARCAECRQQIGIVKDLRPAREPQRLAGVGSQENHADPAGFEDVLQTECEVVARSFREQNRAFVFDADKTGLVPFRRHLDRPLAAGRGHQRKRARLQEVDRLFVEIGGDLCLGGRPGFGENVSQLLDGFDLAHDRDLGAGAAEGRTPVCPQNLARPPATVVARASCVVPAGAGPDTGKEKACRHDNGRLPVSTQFSAAVRYATLTEDAGSETALDRAL